MTRLLSFATLLLLISPWTRASRGEEQVQADSPRPFFREAAAAERPMLEGLADRKCFATERCWIYCRSQQEAESIAADVRAAAGAFARYFGCDPGRGIVITIGGQGTLDAPGFRRSGARWFMPWIDRQELAGTLDQKVMGEVRKQLEAAGLTGALLDQALAQAKEQLQTALGQGKSPLRHELGHVWLIGNFWDENTLNKTLAGQGNGAHYGGPAHDWLDETAAVLMENDDLTADRRRQFREALAADPQRIVPLSEFFTMTHPEMRAAKPAATGKGQPRKPEAAVSENSKPDFDFSITVDAKQEEQATRSSDFYAQCRGFIDFLLERTGDERVFRQIALAESQGRDMAAWLSANGAKLGLPATVDGLNEQFRAWARARQKAR